MWKLVRSEINYLKLPMSVIAAIFIGISLFTPVILRLERYIPSGDEYFRNMNLWIVVSWIMFLFVHAFLELKEARIGRLVRLPVRLSGIGTARILTPLVITLIHVLLTVVCFYILYLVYPARPFFYYTHWSILGYFETKIKAFIADQLWMFMLMFWIVITFRQFTEHYGRLFLLICVILTLFYQFVMPFVFIKYKWIIGDLLNRSFTGPESLIVYIVVTSMIMLSIQQLSFLKRKAWLI